MSQNQSSKGQKILTFSPLCESSFKNMDPPLMQLHAFFCLSLLAY